MQAVQRQLSIDTPTALPGFSSPSSSASHHATRLPTPPQSHTSQSIPSAPIDPSFTYPTSKSRSRTTTPTVSAPGMTLPPSKSNASSVFDVASAVRARRPSSGDAGYVSSRAGKKSKISIKGRNINGMDMKNAENYHFSEEREAKTGINHHWLMTPLAAPSAS